MKLVSIHAENLSIFEAVAAALDEYYWFVESQGGFSPVDEEAVDESEGWIEIEGEESNVSILDRGAFSKVILGRLELDEWTYLTGVRCSPEQLPAVAKAYRELQFSLLSDAHLALVAKWDGLIALHPDGWWEIASSDEALVDEICKGRDFRILDFASNRIGENPP